ncbi:GNAT family N-acetyltransferase [Streptomyces cadmiisoli]|uniref:N-acetyltransferase domain-containing protein n=1 Tax=Streptomyces cadmiisoli TaxID=2184053 RepID=A0A2Z4JEM0_9ACTN|nr:GNAT family N-acetyltransferase [Streptomyces cadmiisoli]AWW43559.1 hypothetical protein DN051_44440 [Streptomyces cadmiisoli]
MVSVRQITTDELAEWVRVQRSAYFMHPTRIDMASQERWFVDGEVFGAYENNECVGTFRSSPYGIVVPGGNRVTAAGITSVAVTHTHRRRGILNRMMHTALASCVSEGMVMAMLVPTEYTLYGRYGFGPAVKNGYIKVSNPKNAWNESLGASLEGSVSLITGEKVRDLGPNLYRKFQEMQAGAADRKPAWWSDVTGEWFLSRRAIQPFYVVHQDGAGNITGLAIYEATLSGECGKNATLRVVDHIFLDDAARNAIWRYIFSLSNVDSVIVDSIPIDDPLPLLLNDPGAAHVGSNPTLWLRILDIAKVLSVRNYAASGSIAISVRDSLGYCSGCWLLTVDESGKVTVTPTSQMGDVELDVDSLSSLYMGGNNAITLRKAGAIRENRPGASEMLQEMFRVHEAPWFPANGLNLV